VSGGSLLERIEAQQQLETSLVVRATLPAPAAKQIPSKQFAVLRLFSFAAVQFCAFAFSTSAVCSLQFRGCSVLRLCVKQFSSSAVQQFAVSRLFSFASLRQAVQQFAVSRLFSFASLRQAVQQFAVSRLFSFAPLR
jgi:hypothetical protein